jgi:hypothetical protein
MFKDVAGDLVNTIDGAAPKLRTLAEQDTERPRAPGKPRGSRSAGSETDRIGGTTPPIACAGQPSDATPHSCGRRAAVRNRGRRVVDALGGKQLFERRVVFRDSRGMCRGGLRNGIASEFSTGETTLALHPASEKNAAGTVEIGFEVPDLQKFYDEMMANGVTFLVAPKTQEYGGILAQFEDSEGAFVSVSGK